MDRVISAAAIARAGGDIQPLSGSKDLCDAPFSSRLPRSKESTAVTRPSPASFTPRRSSSSFITCSSTRLRYPERAQPTTSATTVAAGGRAAHLAKAGNRPLLPVVGEDEGVVPQVYQGRDLRMSSSIYDRHYRQWPLRRDCCVCAHNGRACVTGSGLAVLGAG